MKKLAKFTVIILMLFLTGCSLFDGEYIRYNFEKEESDEQFDYDGNYLPPELNVDGQKTEAEWENASEELTFGHEKRAKVVLYRGERALYAFFEVRDDNILVHSTVGGDDVNKGDSIELYLSPTNHQGNKPQPSDIQINIGVNGKTRILSASDGGIWGLWSGLIDFEIFITDTGFNVELMIPYDQINMSKEDVIGIALGHVNKVGDNSIPGEDYFWEGLVYKGKFVDPQNPSNYLIYKDKKFYDQQNEPLVNLELNFAIKDEQSKAIEQAKITILEQNISNYSDQLGKATLNLEEIDTVLTVQIEKEGYSNYQKTYTISELSQIVSQTITITLHKEQTSITTTLTGTVLNIVDGTILNANVEITSNNQQYTTTTAENGVFSIDVELNKQAEITISKEGYFKTTTALDFNLVKDEGITQLGNLEVLKASEVISFGGQRNITSFKGQFARGITGIHAFFWTEEQFPNNSQIELFINTKESKNERTNTDYRIDFSGRGSIGIVNFGDGSNTDIYSSGITVEMKIDNHLTEIDTFIPYSFLNIAKEEIIGFSLGVSTGADWDGFAYYGEYIPPEHPNHYLRFDKYSQLYKYTNNNLTMVIKGLVESENMPLSGANINGNLTDEEGEYELRVEPQLEITITIEKTGYTTLIENVVVEENILTMRKNFELEPDYYVTIKGSLGVDDVKVYVKEDLETATFSDGNGDYILTSVKAVNDVILVFEKEGYYPKEEKLKAQDLLDAKEYIIDCDLISLTTIINLQGYLNSAYGYVSNASVTVGDKTTQTDELGFYELENIKVGSNNLIIEHPEFQTKEISLDVYNLAANSSLDVEMFKTPGETGVFSGKTEAFTKASAEIKRGINGFYVTFIGETEWRYNNEKAEIIEFFIDTKTSQSSRDETDFLIKIHAKGLLAEIINWGNKTDFDSGIIKISKPNKKTIILFVPYEFLDIEPDEVFGISLGVWNEFVNDFDGWGFDGYVAPEKPREYIRVSADNSLFKSETNTEMED